MSAAATATADAPEAPKKKGKTLLFVIIGVVVLAIAGAAAALFILKKNTAEDEYDDEPVAQTKHADPKSAPTFLPLENMVVNLADAGGNRYIQIGLTLQLQDSATGDAVKAYMPSIRSRILVLLSKRTGEEVLSAEGKDKLGKDIIAAVSDVMGYAVPKDEDEGKRRRGPANPVQAVLFSSFIVQ
ncbi:MAG: flagellar basal body-associated FliL family protein [Hydrogenophaga sp.]|nr:flagellar basal body-associated FliL family protein [Hydrogenophaga sp.]